MKSFAFAALATLALADTPGKDNKAMIGTNVGGWMVLEPWITPSLFYRFLGKTHSEGVGMDQYTFCEALGPEEGNRVLRDHWDHWITEEVLQDAADREVEILRLPIGDWTLKQYGPYVGCTEGADEKIQWLLDTAHKMGMKVLLDVHAVKGSQNGYDNSGLANRTEWLDETHFEHWAHADGEWMGPWDSDKNQYKYIDFAAIDWAKDTIRGLLDRWGHHPAVYAIEPMNEPWWSSDLAVLRGFYRDVRNMMRDFNPDLVFVFHDSFHFDAISWNDMFDDDDMENVVMDTHQYTAWWDAKSDIGDYCDDYGANMYNQAPQIKYPIWVGEWSLATDVCALWLGGFNDNNTPYRYECEWVECPYTYMPEATGTDFDRTAPMLGPYGSNTLSTIQNGMCPRDSTFFADDQVQRLAECVINIFNGTVEGHFLWTVRNELEPRWNYVESYDKGWINQNTFEANRGDVFTQ